jgi:hypothetical protein
MSDTPADPRRINWSELFAFTAIFRSFRMAIDWKKLVLAFVGLFITYVAGRSLDGMWSNRSSPVVSSSGVTELSAFIGGGSNGRAAAKRLVLDSANDRGAKRVGVFSLLLGFARERVDLAVNGVLSCSPGALLGSLLGGLLAIVWLVTMHPLYALIFLTISILTWAYCGGALCRIAAMQATRDERIGLTEATRFSCSKLTDFVFAPIFPFGLIAIAGFVLFVGGLVGMIPWLGDLLVGAFFVLALLVGLVMAFLFIGGVTGFSLFYPTIVVENSDCFDAFSRSFAYIYGRPWKSALYMLVAIAYAAVCLVFVKLFTRITLWLVFASLGFSMNWSRASAGPDDPPPKEVGKLEAMWQGPSLTFENQFIGNSPSYELSGLSWFGQLLMKCWIYALWALVAAFAISMYYSASTIIYLLLRREVDATDFEEVYLEEIPADGSVPRAAAAPAGGGHDAPGGSTSLPVISQ